MKLERLSGRIIRAEFDGNIDLADYASSAPANNFIRNWDEDDFFGGTFDDAIRQAKTGNPEFVNPLFEGISVLEAMIEEEKTGEIRDVTGEYFDVADFLSGEPEVFRRDEIGLQKPVVPVYANIGVNCGIDTKMIINRGSALVALCDELQSAGFIVDIHVVSSLEYNKVMHHSVIKVANDPIDIDALAFFLANPLCFRRLILTALEIYTGMESCQDQCYGSINEYDLPDLFDTGLSGFYFVSSNHSEFRSDNYRTLESAKNHILGMVEQFKESASQIILG